MSLVKRYTEFLFRTATTRNRLKIIMTPVGVIFWFSLGVLFIFASLWLDKILPVHISLPTTTNIFLSLPLLLIGATLDLLTFYRFIKARGTPVPFNPPKKLIADGIYSWVRNPMLVGWFIMMFGLGILLNSFSLIVIFTPLFILINILYLKTIEEKEMEKKFGEEYLRYKERVPLFIPKIGCRK